MSDKVALIVEDTPANRDFFERLFTQAGYETIGVASGSEALEVMTTLKTLPLAIIDMQIPDFNGLDLTSRVRRQFPDCCIVVATMHDERSLMESAFNRGCNVFMVKPHGFMELFKKLTTMGAAGVYDESPLVIDQYGLRPFQALAY